MSQHDMNIANQGFPAFRADMNNAFTALASNSAGTTEPSTTFAYQFWYDETNDLLKLRNSDDDAWITLAAFDQTNDEWELRSAVIQAVDSAGVSIKTDDGNTRIQIQDDGDVAIDTDTLFVDATNNRVGIGTSSPSADLTIEGASSSSITAVGMVNPSGVGLSLQAYQDTHAEIRTTTNHPILFKTNGNNTRMYVHSDGVGINTISPDGKLHVDGITSSVTGVVLQADEAADCRFVDFNNSDGNKRIGLSYDNVNIRLNINDRSENTLVTIAENGTFLLNRYNPVSVEKFGMTFNALSQTGMTLVATGNTTSSQIRFYNNTVNFVGNITTNNSAVTYGQASDYRLKEDWVSMSDSIDRVKTLNPVNFAWKVDGSRVDGFLAHEVKDVVPEAVSGEKDETRTEQYEVTPAVLDDDGNVVTEAVMGTREVPEYQCIDQSKLVPLLTSALQEAIAKIEALEARVSALES